MRAPDRRRFAITAAAIAVMTAGYGAAFVAARASAPGEKVIRISAKRFAYDPAHLTLKKGVPVVLELKSEDVLMGFNAPDFATRADIPPGQVAVVHLRPEKTGTFTFLCDIFCGSGHEEMSGVIVVRP